jgi:hypothetical protein
MINNSFYSQSNINILKSIIKDELKININKNHETIINETMKYVEQNAGSKPPSNMSSNEYLFLMNKKVYDIVLPVIKKDNSVNRNILNNNVNNNVNNNEENNRNNNRNNNLDPQDTLLKKERLQSTNSVFDPVLIKNYETVNIIDYPRPNVLKDKKLDEKMKSVEQERTLLTPTQKNIDFKIDTKEFDKNNNVNNANTTKMYEDLLKDYKKQSNDSELFEEQQKKMNEITSKFEEEDAKKYNSNKLTPVNYINENKNDNKNKTNFDVLTTKNLYGDTSNNNRNDINTFIPYEKTFETTIVNGDSMVESNNSSNNLVRPANNSRNFQDATYLKNVLVEPSPFQSTNNKLTDVILEKKVEIIEKKYYLIFDSKDRNLELYPLPNNFQVKFNPDGNNFKYDNIYDSNGTLIIREKNIIYGDGSVVSIGQTFDNIKKIKCIAANVPTFPQFHGGKGPTLYTKPLSATSPVVQDVNTNNYNPRYTPTTGVYKTIFMEPYLILYIPQLRAPYKGNNIFNKTFAKLSVPYTDYNNTNPYGISFTVLKTDDNNEYFDYNIVSLGKLDKLDLILNNKDNINYNFGIDKLFVESISKGKLIYNGYCGNDYYSTIIRIQKTNSSYGSYCSTYNFIGPCDTLNSHPVSPTDIIYLYDTTPNNNQIVYFESNIYIENIIYGSDSLIINLAYNSVDSNGNNVVNNVIMSNVIPGGSLNSNKINNMYYFIIYDGNDQTYYYLKISGFSSNGGIIVEHPAGFPNYAGNYANLKCGIAKSNMCGSNSELLNSLFYHGGFNVISVGTPSTNNYDNVNDDFWNIEIDYPYDSLPDYLQSENNTYSPGEIFFIQKKMQITYNFEITIGTKDYENMVSRLNEHGM